MLGVPWGIRYNGGVYLYLALETLEKAVSIFYGIRELLLTGFMKFVHDWNGEVLRQSDECRVLSKKKGRLFKKRFIIGINLEPNYKEALFINRYDS